MTMSETAISRFTVSSPLGVRTLRLRLFLLTLVSLKLPEVFRLTSRCCGVVVLGSRPRSFSGHSILMISAPNAPSQRVAHGPARTQLKSTTRIPARAFIRDTAPDCVCSPASYTQPRELRSSDMERLPAPQLTRAKSRDVVSRCGGSDPPPGERSYRRSPIMPLDAVVAPKTLTSTLYY